MVALLLFSPFDAIIFFLMIRRPPRSNRLTHSFPTRRSSDLIEDYALSLGRHFVDDVEPVEGARIAVDEFGWDRVQVDGTGHDHTRSEEHTSELQSLMRISYAVFCLKKKKNTYTPKSAPYPS